MQVKIIALVIVLGLTTLACFSQATFSASNYKPVSQLTPGRWQIYFSPHVRADTYLLDSQTGECYLGVSDKDGRACWEKLVKY